MVCQSFILNIVYSKRVYFAHNTYFYVESQVPISQRESDTKRPMLLRTAPISKINLLLADIPFWIAAASFHILKAWARSLLGSRHHHLIMSCK